MAVPDPAQSRVLLIGFSAFADFARVPAVPNNLRRLKDVFHDERIWGVPQKNITILTGIHGLSRKNLLSRIHDVVSRATDTLVVYYVGHGFLDEDDNDNLLLALPGTKRREHFSALPYEELRRAVRSAGARRKIVVLDCCYSGRAHSNVYLDDSDESREIAQQAPIEGACVLTATSDYARARATPGERYTAFSGALISTLENGIPHTGPHLDIGSIFTAVRQEMRSQGLPRPHLSTRDDGSELILGRNLAHDKDSVGTLTREPEALPPPRPKPVRRRSRLSVGRRLFIAAIALALAAAVTVTVFLTRAAQSSSAGTCPTGRPQEVEPSRADRPGKTTRFPKSGISLLRDLTGPTTVIGFEPPRGEGAHPVTYLWQPDRRCFATPTGFGSDYLDVAVSPDGKWIAGVDMRKLAGADVIVMNRAGRKKRVIDVPDNEFATHLQWNRQSNALLFTQVSVDAKDEYNYPRGADAVMAGLPDMEPTVLDLGANAPYQWGPDNNIAGNFGQEDPLDVRFFNAKGRRTWTIERAGLLGQDGMGAFSPSQKVMVTHCPRGSSDDRACVWDSRLGELLGTYPVGRVFADRPYGSVGWYDEKNLLMTVWDTKTDWWAKAAMDIVSPKLSTAGSRTTLLGRMPDKDGHLIFGATPS